METIDESRADNRQCAGQMLAQKFVRNNFIDGVVIGIPNGGVLVAATMAERLQLDLEAMPCKRIKDPTDSSRSIGSVSADDVYYHDCAFGVPQDFLYYQRLRLLNEIKYLKEFYYGDNDEFNLAGRTVIVVDEMLTSPDSLMAALMSIQKQRPAKVIVAIPFVEAEAARIIQASCDELVFLKMKQHINSPLEFYKDFPLVDEWTSRDALWQSRTELAKAG